ncbi:MAG TPA: glutamate-1-semialdehyde 2,1-aminomutase [Myxococcota bacterium]|nr:glutamate-1-semialdehyde 2,1-aminomutase [Myxococcota bacterium]
MKGERSKELFRRAKRVIPGGVNSPVRAFGAVGGAPRFIARGKGCRIWDVDGNAYLDFVGSWGPLIAGHANPAVLRALRAAMASGTSFGAPTELEVELAELIASALPSVQKLRMVSSGTEATMSALRLARAATGRERVLKFEGCYHGHLDALLLGAGSGVATLGIPGSPGVPACYAELTIQTPFNDVGALRQAFERWGGEIACAIVEPLAGNMGCVPPLPGFLEELRECCDRAGALLIFDEVITGFRLGWGGAQARYRVKPDLTCLGKIIGGGLPAAAYGGRRDLMDQVAPEGSVYQAGTLSGNPLAMAAGLATLRELAKPGRYERLEAISEQLAQGLLGIAREVGVEFSAVAVGGVFGFFFHPGPVRNFADAQKAHARRFRRFFQSMLEQGIYLAPSPYECGFASLAHRPRDVDAALAAARVALRKAARLR